MCVHLENSDEQYLHRAVTGYTAMNLQQVAAKAKKKKKLDSLPSKQSVKNSCSSRNCKAKRAFKTAAIFQRVLSDGTYGMQTRLFPVYI